MNVSDIKKTVSRLNSVLGTNFEVEKGTYTGKGYQVGRAYEQTKEGMVNRLNLVISLVENGDWDATKAIEKM